MVLLSKYSLSAVQTACQFRYIYNSAYLCVFNDVSEIKTTQCTGGHVRECCSPDSESQNAFSLQSRVNSERSPDFAYQVIAAQDKYTDHPMHCNSPTEIDW
jgi:hypothetical protein